MKTWKCSTLAIVDLYIVAQINNIHIRRALVDTDASLNLIPTSTLKAAEISLSQVLGTPMEVAGFAGMQENTIRSIQQILRVGPIVALTRFYVIDSAVSYHALLGQPWLHRHKLVPSTYHQCVKGRFNDKPIRIPTNHTPFDLFEAHHFEADFYDEFTPCGEDATSKPIGTPLPDWEVIEEELEVDLKGILDQKKKKRERKEVPSSRSQLRCVQIQLLDGHFGY